MAPKLPESTDRSLAVAADVGGTHLRVGLVDHGGSVERLAVIPTPSGGVDIIEALIAQITALTATAVGRPIAGIGIGLPGRLRDNSEHWSMALNLGVSSDVALRSRLESMFDRTLLIDNDVRMSTLGAAHHFADVRRIAYLSVGTGVAGGGLARSAHGDICEHSEFVGEIGHVTVPGLTTACLCGQTGCVESAAGGGAMLRRWRDVGGPDAGHGDIAALWDAADGGDTRACSVRDDCVSTLAWVVRLYTVAFGADAVVIGGGVSRLGSRLGEPLKARLDDITRTSALMESFGLADRVRLAPPTSEFGLAGAARLVFDTRTRS